jgi:phosphoenolpyruvate synthase/pyruvate phosphate dikinase
VVTDAQLADAVRTVWGSVWNDAAFEAREAARIDHRAVHAAVLVQQGMNAEASGVMITENPFDPEEPDAVFINAKRGLGMRVVEGKRVAEQLIYHGETQGSLQVLTRSTDDTMLSFDAHGGVKEIRIEEGRFVLTDALALRLAKAGLVIDAWLGGGAQDIEWLTIGERLYIVQARPYLRGH